jgi:hypothetical protein
LEPGHPARVPQRKIRSLVLLFVPATLIGLLTLAIWNPLAVNVTGQLVLPAGAFAATPDGRCSGQGTDAGVVSGLRFEVRAAGGGDFSNRIYAGHVVAGGWCEFAFSLSLPRRRGPYTFDFGQFGSWVLSEADLGRPVTFTLT